MAGCVTATPAPITTVAANRNATSGAAPRQRDPSAVSISPTTAAATTPMRDTNREPTSAARANMTIGTPLSKPIAVPER